VALAVLLLSTSHALAQSYTFTFADATSDGWANSGFGGTPLATVNNFGGTNYITLPLGGFQVGNVSDSTPTDGFYQAMLAAAQNPANATLSYNWYVDTSTFANTTFLQLSEFVNGGNGQYFQDVNEVNLNGTQTSSGQVFTGSVSVNMGAAGLALSPSNTFYRLGLIENGNGTGVAASFTDISITVVPEPASMALLGTGGLALLGLVYRRKRR